MEVNHQGIVGIIGRVVWDGIGSGAGVVASNPSFADREPPR